MFKEIIADIEEIGVMDTILKGAGTSSGEIYELVDGSQFKDADLERGVDQPYEQGAEDNERASSETTRSSSSSGSQTSELLTNINKYNVAFNQSTDDFTSNPTFIQSKTGGIRKKLCFLISLIFVGLWFAMLFGYSIGAHKHYSYAKNTDIYKNRTSLALSASLTTATTTTPMVIPTKSIVSLEEYDIHTSREPIPTKALGTDLLMDSVEFLDAGSTKLSKEDDEGYYVLKQNDDFVLKKLSDRMYSQRLMKKTRFRYDGHEYKIESITPNYKLTKAIIMSDHEKVFRYSSKARYWIYDFQEDTYDALVGDSKDGKIWLAQWSSNFNYISFVAENNLFVYNVKTKTSTKVTHDGSEDILNGRTDWVYEEEVLAGDSAIWWSPDEKSVVFMKTDDSKVPTQNLEFFISKNQFPEIEKLKYPKPGDPNPIVSLHQYILEDNITIDIDRVGSLGEDFVVYGCQWIDETNLVIKETDRTSKVLNIRIFSSETKTSKVTYSIDAVKEYNGWIEKSDGIFPVPKNSSAGRDNVGFIDTIVVDGYNHLGFFENVDSTKPVPLTSGDWEVTSGVISFDAEENLVYFTANRQSSFENHVFSVNLATKQLTAMTEIDEMGYYLTKFSPSSRFSVHKDGPDFPLMYAQNSLRKRGLVNFLGKNKSYHKVKIDQDSDGNPITVNAIEVLPQRFEDNHTHPLLVNIYGGPGSQKVTSKFSVSFEDSISERLNSVILYIDPRGTGGQGWKYRSWSRGHIGHWEARDITTLTKKWIDSRRYIDEKRTAIWGWSYGGFSTLKTLEYDQGQVFKYGMAVAPVTDWLLYDSIYTERYMGLPKNNQEGYAEARINNVEAFRNVKRFLIMHGTGDDNVHVQNSLRLFDEFNLADIANYDMQIFPDSDHNINFHNANMVIYKKLETWLINAFEGHFDDIAYK